MIADAVISNKKMPEHKNQLSNNMNTITERANEDDAAIKPEDKNNDGEPDFLKGDSKKVRSATDYQSGLQTKSVKVIKKKKRMNEIELTGRSLYIFGPDNWLRKKTAEFVQNPYFEAFILHIIGLNSLFMALEEPVLIVPYSSKTLTMGGDIVSILYIRPFESNKGASSSIAIIATFAFWGRVIFGFGFDSSSKSSCFVVVFLMETSVS